MNKSCEYTHENQLATLKKTMESKNKNHELSESPVPQESESPEENISTQNKREEKFAQKEEETKGPVKRRRRTKRLTMERKPKNSYRKPKTEDLTETEQLKHNKIKDQNKIRAIKSRERKRLYVEELEQKVDLLQKQVKYLTIELDKQK